ncbi:TonB-dependent siderophore receptor [Janthinobacterium aquaticum]|uniref:TonB-dependent siderophore receptor n=1 Tax=Janthinobacterium sp. FT58W TaxID=2654254 RepID=UPI0012650806|nr:TonB-dependent siderophore receptor [Janthinobacterium sp. FT58W]KAB8042711.1 TonB-dependent siderophore receptor [Janthinobacterium sp. FT58W]
MLLSLRPVPAAARLLCLTLSSTLLCSPAFADEAAAIEADATTIQTVHVASSREENSGFGATRASASTTKSDLSLFETAQSISVLTRDLLDTRQVTTLNEAIQSSAGVSSGSWGKRGWDDFSIRGQRASESIYVDGLKLNQSNYVAQEVFGVESIEILKGPASINFGLVQPGGMVNMVSKRPRAESFNQAGFAIGNYGYKQATFDLGRPISDSGKAAFRVNGLWSYSDDQTDQVYFKNKYIAPSLSLDFGANTDFTILTSYTTREYLRNQGVPLKGNLLPNRNGSLPRDRYYGEPGFGPYHSRQGQIGYSLVHRFDNGWRVAQNFRWQDMAMDGRFVTLNPMQAGDVLLNRAAQIQDVDGNNRGLDTNAARTYELAGMAHDVMLGLDLNSDQVRNANQACRIVPLNVFNPVYNTNVVCPPVTRLTTTKVSSTGLYLRDQIKLNEQWRLNLAVRHDRARNRENNGLSGITQRHDTSSTTGNAALSYVLTPNIIPYVSYATSFLPVSGSDFFGVQFKPEEGRQAEIGSKFQFAGGRINGAVAVYDLTRQNVTTADPDPAHIAVLSSAQVQTGEQRTRGIEAEISADLRNGWSVQSALTLLDARVTEDNGGTVGRRLLNTPRQSANVWANYRFRGGVMDGWTAGLGARYEAPKTAPTVNYTVGSYTVADASLAYQGRGYRVSLNVKNLFDKQYYAGVLNANVLPLGDPRTAIARVVFDF